MRPLGYHQGMEIAERCHVNLDSKVYHLPNFDVPAGESLDGHFERVTREGFGARKDDGLFVARGGPEGV